MIARIRRFFRPVYVYCGDSDCELCWRRGLGR